ncbi:hypothetical protein U1Q18_034766 [Sarracenia purpurea var. burkii]
MCFVRFGLVLGCLALVALSGCSALVCYYLLLMHLCAWVKSGLASFWSAAVSVRVVCWWWAMLALAAKHCNLDALLCRCFYNGLYGLLLHAASTWAYMLLLHASTMVLLLHAPIWSVADAPIWSVAFIVLLTIVVLL